MDGDSPRDAVMPGGLSPASDRGSPLPLPKHYVVRSALLERIEDAQPGAPLPPERMLAEQFQVSRTTVRQALQQLTAEGRLVRQQGRGTFVARPKLDQQLALRSYTEDMHRQGLQPTSRILQVEVVEAGSKVAGQLGIPRTARAVRLTRLRLANGEPMALEITHLPAKRVEGVETFLTAETSLYAILAEKFAIVPVEAEESIEVTRLNPEQATALDVDADTPCLLLTRRSWDATEVAVEFVESYYRGDRYRFMTRMSRPESRT